MGSMRDQRIIIVGRFRSVAAVSLVGRKHPSVEGDDSYSDTDEHDAREGIDDHRP